LSPLVLVPPTIALTEFGARSAMYLVASNAEPQNTMVPRGNFTLRSRSTTSDAITSTTSQFADRSWLTSDPSPSPQRRPWRPPPQTGSLFQSGHSTGPDFGQTNPPCDRMLASQVRMTSTVAGLAAGPDLAGTARFRGALTGPPSERRWRRERRGRTCRPRPPARGARGAPDYEHDLRC